MPRTSSRLVLEVLRSEDENTDYDGASDLAPFIKTANALCSALVSRAQANSKPVPVDADLAIIETWLAAHFYACSDKPFAANMTRSTQATYQGKTEMYLEATLYGQTAVLLDPTGYLASIGKGDSNKEASGFWAGKPDREALSYDDRNN